MPTAHNPEPHYSRWEDVKARNAPRTPAAILAAISQAKTDVERLEAELRCAEAEQPDQAPASWSVYLTVRESNTRLRTQISHLKAIIAGYRTDVENLSLRLDAVAAYTPKERQQLSRLRRVLTDQREQLAQVKANLHSAWAERDDLANRLIAEQKRNAIPFTATDGHGLVLRIERCE